MRIFPSRRLNSFNFLNGTDLEIRTNKRGRVEMGSSCPVTIPTNYPRSYDVEQKEFQIKHFY